MSAKVEEGYQEIREAMKIKSWAVVYAEENGVQKWVFELTVRMRVGSGKGAVLLRRNVSEEKRVVLMLEQRMALLMLLLLH